GRGIQAAGGQSVGRKEPRYTCYRRGHAVLENLLALNLRRGQVMRIIAERINLTRTSRRQRGFH
ncbi:MAG: hypothetical protein ACE5JO_13325, partial [Candidatus Binatia bacterium]